jgi:nucleotide-binding universal stress UspA family protein
MAAPLIVVGIDGSDESKDALRWAVEEARIREATVRAVHAWSLYPTLYPETGIVASDVKELRVGVRQFVREFVADLVADSPDVDVDAVAIQGDGAPAQVLVEQAADAELLVVGSRGLGGFRELLLGSVSHQCVQHAPCPVVVIRGSRGSHEHEHALATKESSCP